MRSEKASLNVTLTDCSVKLLTSEDKGAVNDLIRFLKVANKMINSQ